MTLTEFVGDITKELEENKDWGDKEIEFRTINRGGLEYLSMYDLANGICIDIGTEEDSDERNETVLG